MPTPGKTTIERRHAGQRLERLGPAYEQRLQLAGTHHGNDAHRGLEHQVHLTREHGLKRGARALVRNMVDADAGRALHELHEQMLS
jgi:hypothetical protein